MTESSNEWINIKDKLPPKNTKVLTYTPSINELHSIKIKWVFSNVVKDMMSSKSRFYEVTHWMPLPKPPQ